MTDHWELVDVVKVLLALVAGMMLGLERELKDKSAGLKTMSVICLGATLFSILSYKVGGPENTRIASYIVSGVGFIGAGVIFKEGLNISGLTTAGLIWLAAAIGTSIGFGEFFLAATVMAAALILIFSSPFINRLIKSRRQIIQLEFELEKQHAILKDQIISSIREKCLVSEKKPTESKEGIVKYRVEIEIAEAAISWLKEYLLQHEKIKAFSIDG
jgi:putative Mg2+ transporter-C (MgtC) family protein